MAAQEESPHPTCATQHGDTYAVMGGALASTGAGNVMIVRLQKMSGDETSELKLTSNATLADLWGAACEVESCHHSCLSLMLGGECIPRRPEGDLLSDHGFLDGTTVSILKKSVPLIISALVDCTIKVFDSSTGECIKMLPGKGGNYCYRAAMSTDGSVVVLCHVRDYIQIWHISADSGERSLEVSTPGALAVCAAVSPDGARVVVGVATADNNSAKIFDSSSGECIKTQRHESEICGVAFSADGSRIATASADEHARIWDCATGDCIQTLSGHDGSVKAAAFSPDGSRVVTTSSDCTAKIWDSSTGKCTQTLSGHDHVVTAAAFSPDGSVIVTACRDRTSRIWDASTGECRQIMTGSDDMEFASFSPDGLRIVTGSDGCASATIWDSYTGKVELTFPGEAIFAAFASSYSVTDIQ